MQTADDLDVWHDRLDKFDLLFDRFLVNDARNVCTGMFDVPNEAGTDRVADGAHDDGRFAVGNVGERLGCRSCDADHDSRIFIFETIAHRFQAALVSFRILIIEPDRLAGHVAVFLQGVHDAVMNRIKGGVRHQLKDGNGRFFLFGFLLAFVKEGIA